VAQRWVVTRGRKSRLRLRTVLGEGRQLFLGEGLVPRGEVFALRPRQVIDRGSRRGKTYQKIGKQVTTGGEGEIEGRKRRGQRKKLEIPAN